ncbi:MAG TPA: 3-oxoacid CoA-transferase, partial [bacterium]|nr:3-oxoacid CoA-transferase [bacterium]
PALSGPYRVITQLGVYGFDDTTKRIKLLSVHPGVTVEQVLENSGMDIIIPEFVENSPEPTEDEIRILHEIDPTGIVIK